MRRRSTCAATAMGRLLCAGRAHCGGVAVGGAAAEDALTESEAPLAPRVVRLGGTVHLVVQMCAHYKCVHICTLYHAFLQLPFSGSFLGQILEIQGSKPSSFLGVINRGIYPTLRLSISIPNPGKSGAVAEGVRASVSPLGGSFCTRV